MGMGTLSGIRRLGHGLSLLDKGFRGFLNFAVKSRLWVWFHCSLHWVSDYAFDTAVLVLLFSKIAPFFLFNLIKFLFRLSMDPSCPIDLSIQRVVFSML